MTFKLFENKILLPEVEGFQSPELFWLTTHFRMCFSRVLATLNGIPQNLSTALLD